MKPFNFLLGLVLILLGTFFFMNSIGYRSWSLLRLLPIVGPLLLILFGLSLLWKGRIPGGVALALVILCIGATVVYLINPKFNPVQKIKTQLQVDRSAYPDLSAGKLELKYGAGELVLGSATEHWAEGRFRGLPAAMFQKIMRPLKKQSTLT